MDAQKRSSRYLEDGSFFRLNFLTLSYDLPSDLLKKVMVKSASISVSESNSETIFAIRMVKDKDYEDYYMAQYSVGGIYSMIDDNGWGEMYPSYSYLSLLDENESDLRHAFIVDQVKEPESL